MAERRGDHANDPPDVSEIERLFEELPDYEEFVDVAVDGTERSVQAAGARLWEWFGLDTTPPNWNGASVRGRGCWSPARARRSTSR